MGQQLLPEESPPSQPANHAEHGVEQQQHQIETTAWTMITWRPQAILGRLHLQVLNAICDMGLLAITHLDMQRLEKSCVTYPKQLVMPKLDSRVCS